MAGKYDKVIHALPRMLGEDPPYQEKVEAVKTAMASDPGFQMNAINLAREFCAIRAEKDAATKVLSEINLRLEAVSQMMADQYEVEGVSTIRIDGRPVSTRLEPWAKVIDRELFREWCERDPDLRRLMSLPWMTVNKITKDRLIEGEPEPPGVTIFARTRFTLGSEG
jgi:hypothetical protein